MLFLFGLLRVSFFSVFVTRLIAQRGWTDEPGWACARVHDVYIYVLIISGN